MKLPDVTRVIHRPKSSPSRPSVLRVLQVSAGVASAVWLALRVRKELYGPGGTKLSRYPLARDADDEKDD